MRTYENTITWMAEQVYQRWQKGEIGWKGSIGCECNTIAFIYNRQVFDVSQDIWSEVINTYGDPLKS